MASIEEKVKKLQGPILVLGASGFIGANLLRAILKYRDDVHGTYFHSPAWRLEGLPSPNLIQTDLLVDANLDYLLDSLSPKTIFNCVAFGAYSFETDSALIYRTNFNMTEKLLCRLEPKGVAGYVHAGSSSEYGDHASGPAETDLPSPNSDYAVSKVAVANLLDYYGKKKKFPCANLRLYSVYGPLEDSSRLIPKVVSHGVEGKYPELVNPDISRDFVYIDDVNEAFLDTALNLKPAQYGDSFNIGSGKKTTIAEVAKATAKVFGIKDSPAFNTMPNRKWDLSDWFANTKKAKEALGWEARTSFQDGLKSTAEWYKGLEDRNKYEKSSKQFELDAKHSVSAIIACYKDNQAIPIMYLVAVFFFILYEYVPNWKRWLFIGTGVCLPIGLYAFQHHVIYLVALFLFAIYECVTNWKAIKAYLPTLGVFVLIFLTLSFPFFKPMITGQSSTRFNQLSIFNRCQQMHSLEPLKVNVAYTSLMYNRRGDPNPRHNLQDHRQLDDVTGFLLFFGVFYALSRFWRRKYYYALVGFFIMALPCLITIDPAHSSRMYCQTAFVAFLAASVIGALWARARAMGGQVGEILFLVLMIPPLTFMGRQNFQTYFVEQANNYASWAEFSIAESTIGREFAKYGDNYDCYVSGRYYMFYTIDYLDYFFLDNVKKLDLPESLGALPAPGRGLIYALEQGRIGVLDTLKAYYPGGEAQILKDPNGNGFVYFYRVPPEMVDKARGLKAEFSDGKEAQVSRFPEALPPGPYHATFKGDLYLDQSGEYRFHLPEGMKWTLGGKPAMAEAPIKLEKGFHPVVIHWSAPEGAASLVISYDGPVGKNMQLGTRNFITIASVRGLKGQYYNGLEVKGSPFLEQWEPVLNFVNGNDFPVQGGAMAVHWSGTLKVPETGEYRFATRTSGQGGLKIDRRTVIAQGANQGQTSLAAGTHSVDVFYAKQSGYGADYTFLWIKPGNSAYEVVPNSAFGEVR